MPTSSASESVNGSTDSAPAASGAPGGRTIKRHAARKIQPRPTSSAARPSNKAGKKPAVAEQPEASSELVVRSDRVIELSDQWFGLLKSGQGVAFDGVRKFIDTVDVILPLQGGDDSKRRTIIGGAIGLAERMSEAQLNAMRSIVQSTVSVSVGVAVDVDHLVDVAVDVF